MPSCLLTPASISYLNQFILSILIAATLARRNYVRRPKQPSQQDTLLFAFFTAFCLFSLLLFLEATSLPSERLYVVYLQNPALGILLIFLSQFAYFFPNPNPKQTLERRLALLAMSAYTLWEVGFAVWRFNQLRFGQVEFRPDLADVLVVLAFLWIILIFARRAFQKRATPGGHYFGLIFLIPLWLAILNLLRTFYHVSNPFYHINMSVGILVTIFLFVLHYLTAQPEKTSFIVKIAGAMLTALLAFFGVAAWLVTPAYAEQYSPNLPDHRTLRFSPNQQGGYDVAEVPFWFDNNLGENLHLTDDSHVRPSADVEFDFPFFGRRYTTIFILNDGVLGIGANPEWRDFQYKFSPVPAIIPLFVDIIPEKSGEGGGVFMRREPDRLVVTYKEIPAFSHPEDIYTFQVILYANGSFDFTYNGLPTPMTYYIGDRPEATVQALGVKPAIASNTSTDLSNLPILGGPNGIIQDEYRSFRLFIHAFLVPLALATLGSSIFFPIISFALFNHGLAQPLDSLLRGVQALNGGQRNVVIPVKFNDEIGYLTQSINNLSGELNGLIADLENRVSTRTSDLVAVNEQLRNLSVAVEQSPSTIIITDIDANIEYVNPAFVRSTNYTFEEVKGKNPRLLKSGLTPQETYQQMWADLTAGKPWRGELINKKKEGQIFWEYTVITPILDANGRLTHYAAIKEDVTARVLAEKALRESEEQYRLLFDLESDAIFIIRNEDGQILEANDAAVALYGYTREELLSIKNTDLSAEPDSTRQATRDKLPRDQVVVIPLRYHRKKDGTVFPVEITARFITWKGESVHIAAIRDFTQRMQIEQELVRLATTDPLTEIYNRRHFNAQAEQMLARTQQPPDHLAILMIDVDHFKNVNDTYGHAIGDIVLKQLAERLGQNMRPTDILARYGGEEFVILLPRTSMSEAEEIARRLCRSVGDHPFEADGAEVHITLSIGLAGLDKKLDTLDSLIHHADVSLYQAKQAGRNQWKVWGSLIM